MTETIKLTPTPTPAPQAQPASIDALKQLMQEIQDLKNKVDAKPAKPVTAAAPKSKEIDWTKITEADIANLDVPIPVIEQETPEYLTVNLKDKNYVPRWVHILPERLGVCLSTGYTYVEEADLDPNYPHPLKFDVNAKYSHGDVVCLKILKSRYYGAIKRNYLKTMSIHGKAQVRDRAMRAIENDNPQIADAIHRGAMTLYEPEDMKGKEISSELFSPSL